MKFLVHMQLDINLLACLPSLVISFSFYSGQFCTLFTHGFELLPPAMTSGRAHPLYLTNMRVVIEYANGTRRLY